MSRVKRLVVTAAVVWGLIVLGLGYYAVREKPATIRDQTTIAQALPTVDAALTDLAAGLDPATSVPVLSGYAMVGRSCSVTLAREGARWERTLVVYTSDGGEKALLERVKAALPTRYKPSLVHNVLSADAGNYVAVRGGVTGPGQIRFTADTGCRPQNKKVTEAQPPNPDAGRAPVQTVLDTLKLTDVTWHAHLVTCPGGGSLWTVQADTASGSAPKSLTDALKLTTGVVLARPEVVAFRNGPTAVAVRSSDGRLTITSTTSC
jgi:hypothetical protein